MSLVICSNVQGEYSNQGDNPEEAFATKTGIQDPASFHNHLVNPMKLPPNTEVAVASVKIKRQQVYNIKDTDIFYFQMGTALEDTDAVPTKNQSINLTGPQKVRIQPGTYSQTTLKKALGDALKEVLTHPNYFRKVEVIDKLSNEKVWEGFTFKFSQISGNDQSTNSASLMTSWQSYHPNTKRNSGANGEWTAVSNGTKLDVTRTYDQDGANPKNNTLNGMCIINTDSPMDLGANIGINANAPGYLVFELYGDYNDRETAEASFFITRPPGGNNGDAFQSTYDEKELYNRFQLGNQWSEYIDTGGNHPVADYIVSWNNYFDLENGDDERRLFIHQNVWDEAQGGCVLKEVEYWNAGIVGVSTQIKESDIGSPGAPGSGWDYPVDSGATGLFPYFRWEFIGSQMRLSMAKHTKGSPSFTGGSPNTWQIICDNTNTATDDSRYTFAPITQNKEALYMGVSQNTNTKKVVIHEAYIGNPAGYEFGTQISSTNVETEHTPTHYWGKVNKNPTPYDLGVALQIESCLPNQMVNQPTITHIKRNGTTDSLTFSRVLILNTPERQTTDDGVYYPTPGANMGRYLGFPDLAVISSSFVGSLFQDDGTTADTDPAFNYILSSIQQPELTKHSCFIKCPSLTAQSYNFCKSKPSQILYHMPRFDNYGNDTGDLFFEVKDRLYLDLKNIDFLNLNELELQICNKDEQVVQDLVGDTIITLHFRHKSDRY
jgi:hypothetical protein